MHFLTFLALICIGIAIFVGANASYRGASGFSTGVVVLIGLLMALAFIALLFMLIQFFIFIVIPIGLIWYWWNRRKKVTVTRTRWTK